MTDAFQALRDQIKRIQMGAWPNAVYLFGLVDNLERQVHEGITHLQKALDSARRDCEYHSDCRPNRRQAEAAMADAKATNDRWADEVTKNRGLQEALEAWRGWAQFVYLGGGSVTLDDKALQSAVCAKHDEETLAARRDTPANSAGPTAAERDELIPQDAKRPVPWATLPYERVNDKTLMQCVRLFKDEHLLVLRPFGWHLDGSHIPNAAEHYSRESVCEDHRWRVVCDYGPYIAVVTTAGTTRQHRTRLERGDAF